MIEVLEITAQCASNPQRVDDPARSGPSEATEARDQGLLLSDVRGAKGVPLSILVRHVAVYHGIIRIS